MSEELRVLVVDDEELARLRMRSLVADCPAPKARVVGEAGNTGQALAWIGANECDLVLLDIHMPGPDGTQLAARLRLMHDVAAQFETRLERDVFRVQIVIPL